MQRRPGLLARSRSPNLTRGEASRGEGATAGGGTFLSCFYKPTRSTSPHKCTATRDQACWGAGTGGRPGRHPLGADTEPVRDRGLVVRAVHPWWVVGLAHALLSSAPWVPAGLGHTTVRVWTMVKPSGAPLLVGELGAPPRGKSKRKVSQLGQEPEAGRALDSALAGGVRGEVGLLRDPGGGAPGDTSGVSDFGERSHFPALLTGRRSHSAGGTRAAWCFHTACPTPSEHRSEAQVSRRLPARSSEPGVLPSEGGARVAVIRGAALFPRGLFVIGFARAVLEASIKEMLSASMRATAGISLAWVSPPTCWDPCRKCSLAGCPCPGAR